MCLKKKNFELFHIIKLKQNDSDPDKLTQENVGVGYRAGVLIELLYSEKGGRKTDQGRAVFSLHFDTKLISHTLVMGAYKNIQR